MFNIVSKKIRQSIKKVVTIFNENRVTVLHNLQNILSNKSHTYEHVNYPFYKVKIHEAFPELLNEKGHDSYLSTVKKLENITLVGQNWLEEDPQKRKPIIVIWGFNDWKYGFTADYLSDYRVLFPRCRFALIPTILALYALKNILKEDTKHFIVWGKKDTLEIKIAQKLFKASIFYIEDGFLRSVGVGTLHTTPYSLCLDKKGIYFNANQPSDIEDILNTYDFEKNPKLIQQSKASIALFHAGKLSKYYVPAFNKKPQEFKVSQRYAILIVGQVEDDASIIHGMKNRMSNNKFIQYVRKKHPIADIYYRPHPDVLHNNRKRYSNPEAIQDICIILDPEIDLYTAITQVDHVYTMTSLVGMEALILGKKVTTLGAPFYAGWGLGKTLETTPRRTRKLTLEQIFAGAYLLYPQYFHPVDSQKIDFLELSSYFIMRALLEHNIFSGHKIIHNFNDIIAFKEHYSIPLQLYLYIQETKIHGSADLETVMAIINKNDHLRDFEQITQILIASSNYTILVAYCNKCLDNIDKNINLRYNTNILLLERFFYSLAIAFKNTGGRIIQLVPNINETLLNDTNFNHAKYNTLITHYLRCLSCNLQYQDIEEFIASFVNKEVPASILQKFINILMQKPTRSERNHAKRNAIIEKIANEYLNKLNQTYPSKYDFFINKSLYYIALNQSENVITTYTKHLKLFDEDSFSFSNPEFNQWGDLSNRISHFQQIFSYLLKYTDAIFAEKMLQSFYEKKYINAYHTMKMTFFVHFREYDLFLKYYSRSVPDFLQKSPKNLLNYIYVLKCIGEFNQALKLLQEYQYKNMTLDKYMSIKTQINRVKFLIETNKIIKSYPQPKSPKGVVFIATQNCYNSLAMMTPVYLELKKRGYAVINLTEGLLPQDNTNISYIDCYESIIPHETHHNSFKNKWYINWSKKQIVSNGINFYQGFYENLSCFIRSFFVDLNIPIVHAQFTKILERSDTVMDACQQIYQNLTLKYNMPTIFVSSNTHVAPYSSVRDFCRDKDHPLLSFIHCNLAYENYFSNLGGKFANTMAVTDMTLYPNIRAPFLARKDQFDKWYAKNQDNQQYLKQAQSVISVNRNNSTSNSSALKLIEYLKEQKQKGKKILCAFGKITVDLCVPYDGGNAHEDMADWLNHTVKSCGESDDVILLVKPHPHELRPEIALDVQEYFPDLIHEEIKPNVRILEHKEINVHELAPYIDLAILWNGSSGLELTAQGIPVIMCAHFGKHDYPVDLIYPESRVQYANYLKAGQYRKPDAELQKRAAFLISYLGTDEITLINQYSLRPVTNDKIGVPKWNLAKINHYLKNGDPFIETAANRIIEKVERTLDA